MTKIHYEIWCRTNDEIFKHENYNNNYTTKKDAQIFLDKINKFLAECESGAETYSYFIMKVETKYMEEE
jgi:hypothetical protein